MEATRWGDLTPGPFPVGFRTRIARDYSRTYGALGFRPILVATWYPAATSSGAPLTYGDYLRLETLDGAAAPFAARMTGHLRDVTIQYGLGRDPTRIDAECLRELAERERLSLTAVRDAAPASGRFPVVVYHPGLGGTYEDNGILFEYLASQGYVVVSSGYQTEDPASLHLNWDLDRSYKDFAFLMNAIAADPSADTARVGVVGQSYGGQAAMAWSSEPNAPVRAVVSLDSTVDYRIKEEAGFEALRKPLERVDNITAAWLLFAVAERAPHWDQWEYLTRTPRWFAATGPMGHDDFTAQGMIGTVRRSGDLAIRRRYEAVCSWLRTFLDTYLKDDPSARSALLEPTTTDPTDLTLTYRPPAGG